MVHLFDPHLDVKSIRLLSWQNWPPAASLNFATTNKMAMAFKMVHPQITFSIVHSIIAHWSSFSLHNSSSLVICVLIWPGLHVHICTYIEASCRSSMYRRHRPNYLLACNIVFVLLNILYACMIGYNRDVGNGGMQEFVHGDEVEEGAQIHSVQDRWRF